MTRLPLRDPGTVEAVQAALPESAIALAALLTWLGDPILLLGVVAVYGWRLDQRGGRAVIGLAVAATALTVGLKAGIGLPRPPAALRVVAEEGAAVPSGHALGATTVWGGLALAWDRGSHRLRLAAAAGLVVLVSATRVAIGVHYPFDVLAGVAVGLALLVGYRLWCWEDRRRAAWLAAALALGALAAAGPTRDALLVLGAAVGLVTAPLLPYADRDGESLSIAAVGGGLAALLAAATVGEVVPRPVAVPVGAAVIWWILAAPAVTRAARRRATTTV